MSAEDLPDQDKRRFRERWQRAQPFHPSFSESSLSFERFLKLAKQLADDYSKADHSEILDATSETEEAENKPPTRETLNATIGSAHHEMPSFIHDEAVRITSDRKLFQEMQKYSGGQGIDDVRETVAAYASAQYAGAQPDVYSKDDICMTDGAQAALDALIKAANKTAAANGQQAQFVVPTPSYFYLQPLLEYYASNTVPIQTDAQKAFTLSPDNLQKTLGDIDPHQPVYLMLNIPSNPSGTVYSEQELKALATVLNAHPNVQIVMDEAYRFFEYEGNKPLTLLDVDPSLRDRTHIIITGSKLFTMSGTKAGAVITQDQALLSEIVSAHHCTNTHASAFGQYMFQAGLKEIMLHPEHIAEITKQYKDSRDALCEPLIEGNLKYSTEGTLLAEKPAGGFFAFPCFGEMIGQPMSQQARDTIRSVYPKHSDKIETDIDIGLEAAARGILTMPGSYSGANATDGFMRVSFSLDHEKAQLIGEGLTQMVRNRREEARRDGPTYEGPIDPTPKQDGPAQFLR